MHECSSAVDLGVSVRAPEQGLQLVSLRICSLPKTIHPVVMSKEQHTDGRVVLLLYPAWQQELLFIRLLYTLLGQYLILPWEPRN